MIALLLLAVLVGPARAAVHLTTEEALALAFAGCEVEERTVYLSDSQARAAAQRAGVEVETRLVRQYVGRCDGAVAGTAYFDTHRVRTLPETLMVVIDPGGAITRIEVLSFREPEEYLPPAAFFGQFPDKGLEDLSWKRADLRKVTGATLSCTATLEAARRVLALHQVIGEGG